MFQPAVYESYLLLKIRMNIKTKFLYFHYHNEIFLYNFPLRPKDYSRHRNTLGIDHVLFHIPKFNHKIYLELYIMH